jgi:hypothetical protein
MLKKIIVFSVFAGLIGAILFGSVSSSLAMTNAAGSIQGPGDLTAESTLAVNNRGGRGSSNPDFENGTAANGRSGLGQFGGYGQGIGIGSNYQEFTLGADGELSAGDKEALIFMREEEKLAHDVYVAMDERWDLPIFQNISRSEQTHTGAVKNLLDGYNIPDPASSELGVFTNPDLQALYSELVAQGSQSLSEALRVGAAIEEIDILDLQDRLAETGNSRIQQVFSNLLRGSYNHLNAFTTTLLTQTGETYQPQIMSVDDYQASPGGSSVGGTQGKGMRGGRGGRP